MALRRLFVAAALWSIAFSAPAVELKLADGGGPAKALRRKTAGVKPAEQGLEEPEYASSKPLYIALELGDDLDSVFTGAIDESGGTGSGYDRLYLDANNDGNLANEIPMSLQAAESGANSRTSVFELPRVVLDVPYFDGAERRLPVKITLYKTRVSAGKYTWQYTVLLDAHLEAQIKLGDAPGVLVALYDKPAPRASQPNGCFNNPGVDLFGVDADGDGKLDLDKEVSTLGKVFTYGGKLWEVSVDAAGLDMSVKLSALKPGSVRFKALYSGGSSPAAKLRMASKSGSTFSCGLPMSLPMVVHEGSYDIASESFSLADAGGTNWATQFKMPSRLDIGPGGGQEFTFGSPIKVVPKVSGSVRPGKRLYIRGEVVGVAGEVYSSFTAQGRRQAPMVQVTDAAGKVLSQGRMRYG